VKELRERKKFEFTNSSPEAQDIIKMLKGDLNTITKSCKTWQQQIALTLLTQESEPGQLMKAMIRKTDGFLD